MWLIYSPSNNPESRWIFSSGRTVKKIFSWNRGPCLFIKCKLAAASFLRIKKNINTCGSWRYMLVWWSEMISLCKILNIIYNIIPVIQSLGHTVWSYERSILLNWFFLVNKLNQFTTSNWNSTDLQVTQSNLTFKNLTDTLTRNEPKHRRICSYDEWTHCMCKKLSLRSLFTSCALYRCFKNIFAYTFCHCVITWMDWWSEPFHWNKMSKRTSSWKIIVFVGLPEVLDYRK